MSARTETSSAVGAYGLRLDGIASAAGLLNACPSHWPGLTLERREGGGRSAAVIGHESAEIALLAGGRVTVDRATTTAVYETPVPLSDDAIVHPYLAPVAAVVAAWMGRQTFHGAAFSLDGGAWIVLADAAGGKSSLIAELARRGIPVIADDLVVLDDGSVLAGPRCVDLRADVAAALGVGSPLGVVGGRERWRIPLASVRIATPVSGFVALDWTAEDGLAECTPAETLAALHAHRGVERGQADLEQLLALCDRPMLRLARRRDLDGLSRSCDQLLDALTGGR